MIERYSITASTSELADRFSIDVPDFYRPHYNAAPTQLLPIITSSASKGLSVFYWGTSPEWSKNRMPSEKMINARTENFEDKPALKRAVMKSRCIIPADGFYSWRKVGKKTSIPYRFVLASKDLFSIAGMWEEFEDTDGNQIQTFSMITTLAAPNLTAMTERTPLILSRENETVWLSASAEEPELMEIVNQPGLAGITFYPVSPGISNTNHDLASMILPTPPSDQHGNLTLFD